MKAIYSYLNRIRNDEKRCYGFVYLAWLRNGCAAVEPERNNLSYLAAQSVRMRLVEMLKTLSE